MVKHNVAFHCPCPQATHRLTSIYITIPFYLFTRAGKGEHKISPKLEEKLKPALFVKLRYWSRKFN